MTRIAVIDSNVYIGLFRRGLFQGELATINSRFILKTSSVVLLELYQGCINKRELREIEKLEKTSRIICPTPQNWTEVGKLLNRVVLHQFEARKIRDLENDALIAISAKATGAMVITNNKKDFELIREARPFDVIYL